MDSIMPLWAVCCYALEMLLPDAVMRWLPLLSRTAFLGILSIGGSILWRRLWQTHRFMSQLKVVATDLSPARLVALCAGSGLVLPPVVTLATPVPLAFCAGLFWPRICLSTGLLDALNDKELKAVLLHEAHHCRHYDPLRTLLADVLAGTLFFLPAVAEWRDMFLTSTECAADRYAIQLAGRPSLAGAIYKLITHPQAIRLSPALSGMSGFSATQTRLGQLLDDASLAHHFSPRSLLISSLVLTFGCVPLQLALI
jgi:Zn-dependent protease with chaperone function